VFSSVAPGDLNNLFCFNVLIACQAMGGGSCSTADRRVHDAATVLSAR
jgi:hypothetical protein